MKNVNAVSNATKNISYSNRVPIYYDIKNDTVYTEQMKNEKGLTDLFYLTDLIRYNNPEEVKKTVYKFLWL